MSGRACVIGAGVTGLVAALDLARRGWQVDVLERWPGLGGQAATFDPGGGALIERYYHHWFTSDAEIIELCRELGVEIDWRRSSVSFFVDGRAHPFDSPADLLRFKPLSPLARLRMGLAVVVLKLGRRDVGPFEDMTARDWVVSRMGPQAWEGVWGPMMRKKFGGRAEDISMSWLWARLSVRRQVKGSESRHELLGYPRGSFEALFRRLREEIEARGGRVLIDRPARRVSRGEPASFEVALGAAGSFRSGHDPGGFAEGGSDGYDAVIATVPNRVFEALLSPELSGALAPGYLDRLRGIEYQAAKCLVLELDRRFSAWYWMNVAAPELPFLGLIEQGNLVGTEPYGGRHFLYVANYLELDDPLLELDADGLLDAYEPGLRAINPGFDRSWVRQLWEFHEPDAQPLVTPGYARRMPPLATGVEGLVLANTSQIYPEDRGTNYAVRLGREAALLLG